jgi:hypothetical protein
MNCQFCEHAIDEHNSYNGCVHVKRVNNRDLVCPCMKKPSEIVAELEEAARELVEVAHYIPFAEKQWMDGTIKYDVMSEHTRDILLDKLAALLERN